ncbi:MAG: hypothetical protein JSS60_01970 [Verrucomicrobia bacterium]|nr:hypothetical protein [Verrucomicrobiota bacterium]
MNFTREPIIETIISPKEGCKLLVRSSKAGSGAEEYYVDAVEVVSFGHAFFFRSTERPKAFLVPASDYEVLEVKEVRVALKNVSHDRNIKIGGGRDASMRHSHREPPQEREQEPASAEEEQQPVAEEAGGLEAAIGARMDKRRDRRRRRHRRSGDEQDWGDRRQQQHQQQQQQQHEGQQATEGEQKAQGGGAEDEAKVSSPMFSSLIPPPPTLISETLSRYKDKEFMEGSSSKEVEPKEEKKRKEPPVDEEPTGSESAPLNRVSTSLVSEHLEINSFTSTNFSPLQGGNDNFFY